jgi:hypothetical protein
MYRFVFVLCLIASVLMTGASVAEIPKLINYQGMLTDDSGIPLTGSYSITFKIYNAESDGTKKWEETQPSVSVTKGLYNVILGSVTPINLDFSEDYWLDVTVEAEHMPTRLKFASVGYAYRASVADSAVVAGSGGGSGGWVDDGTVVRLQNSADAVGVGTTNPISPLHIHGPAPDDANNGQLAISESTSGSDGILLVGRTTDYGFIQSHNHQPLVLNPIANNVGIGITDPLFSLHVVSDHTVMVADDYGYGTYAYLAGTNGAYGYHQDSGNYGCLGTLGSGVYFSGGLAGTGTKSCIIKTSQGPTLLYCQESPENWFEDFGEARLIAGRCHIELDPLFLETLTIDDRNPMKVFVQLNDDCGGVYVERGSTGFDVIELQGGKSNARFTYRVVAKRQGFEEKRLDVYEDAMTDPYLYPEMKGKDIR